VSAIVLAHEPSFTIGAVEVRPPTRTVSRDGTEEIVEPRVMQVLVALAASDGDVVSRDDLVERCWDGRIVGDDAINRVISRLRRLADGIGRDAFTVDTITKTGYRLRRLDGSKTGHSPIARSETARRKLLVTGSAALAVAAVGGGSWTWLNRRDEARLHPSPTTAALMQQALLALRQGSREGQNQAIGLYRQVVADSPDYADGWGALGIAYAFIAQYRPKAEAAVLQQHARAAGERAHSIDPDNALAAVALATARPTLGNWSPIEAALRSALKEHPRNEHLLFSLANLLAAVGRNNASLALHQRLAAAAPPTPIFLFRHIISLWSAGRIEETDALIAEASRLYPTHYAIWFSRFYILMYSGRAAAAVALAADQEARPSGVPEKEVESGIRVARAMVTRAPAEIDAVISEQLGRASRAAGAAENAAQFAAALGRIDDSFHILDAYYFAEGFDPGEVRFDSAQGTFTPRNDRLTAFLFNPALAPLRGDGRFARLTERLGLTHYWRDARVRPDYLTQA
jgi:DNA-binding winged helix-turn-helix (wHTH) protein/tetratricopeptide (TPR) repeat protein